MTADDLAAAFDTLPPEWRRLVPGWTAPAQAALVAAIRGASGQREIAPADPFRALRLVAPDATRVVVLGQDPYPGAGHADGLAFSAPASTRPSLRRIFEVLESDRPGWKRPRSGRLEAWAAQGVLLLNPTLTVEVGVINSHTRLGWQALTAQLVQALAMQPSPPLFMLWGSQAAAFAGARVSPAWSAAIRPTTTGANSWPTAATSRRPRRWWTGGPWVTPLAQAPVRGDIVTGSSEGCPSG
jgi:uracil-DNA glycosylase